MTSRSVVFAEPVRTAIGTLGGTLKDVPAPTLDAVAIGGAVARAGLRPDELRTVVMGNVVQAGENRSKCPAKKAPPCSTGTKPIARTRRWKRWRD
jgi:acetyl-CoA C-acetyltransferase